MIEPCVLEPLRSYPEYPPAGMVERARRFHADIARRRTVRDLDRRPAPREVIEPCLLAAGTAPQECLDALAAGRHLAR